MNRDEDFVQFVIDDVHRRRQAEDDVLHKHQAENGHGTDPPRKT